MSTILEVLAASLRIVVNDHTGIWYFFTTYQTAESTSYTVDINDSIKPLTAIIRTDLALL